jgi:hypothetical protein
VFGYAAIAQAPFASLGGNAFIASLSETAVINETSSCIFNLGGLYTEQASVTSSVSNSNNILTATATESAAGAVTVTSLLSAFGVVAEQSQASVVATSQADMYAAVSESALATDSPQAVAAMLAAVAEVAQALDAPEGSRVFFVAVSESASGLDAVTVQAAFTGTVAEVVHASATASTVKSKNVYVTGVQLYVRIGDALVWGVIDTNQNPNWTIINDVQSPGWTDIPS